MAAPISEFVEKKKEEKTEWEMDAEWKAEMLQEDGKLIVEEESSKGHISWGSIKMYLVVLGGRYWMIFWPAFTFAIVFECGIEVLQPWLLGAWAMEYTIHPDPADMDVTFYLVGYVLLVCLMLTVFFVAQTTLALGALRASALLHKWLIKTILRTTLWTLLATSVSASPGVSPRVSPGSMSPPPHAVGGGGEEEEEDNKPPIPVCTPIQVSVSPLQRFISLPVSPMAGGTSSASSGEVEKERNELRERLNCTLGIGGAAGAPITS
ncbi:hypothetical protein E4T56_gene3971 [Termitomyces sp. T112]|nr:hypothetical protein E4T56_gene3971 [Termitomyces sp. T112]